MIGCGVYKYVYHNEIIYIGMSDNDISKRVRNHAKERAFRPYLKSCQVYYIPLKNHAQARGVEALLIDMYKPILNIEYKYNNGGDINIDMALPEWIKYKNKKDIRQNPRGYKHKTGQKKIAIRKEPNPMALINFFKEQNNE